MGAPIENNMLENELAELVEKKQKIAEKWGKVGFFKNIGWEELDSALILENQRVFNESFDDNGDHARFKRLSIPLAYRVWNGLIVRKIASAQPLFLSKDYYYHIEYNGKDTSMKKTEVQTQCHKMKAHWSYEAQQDGRRYHTNLDYEAELTAVLAQELSLELDRRCLHELRANAGTNLRWDFATCLGDTIKGKYEDLYIQLNTASDIVENKTQRGKANWIVTSPEIASIFETSCTGFYPASDDYSFTSSLGITYVGTFGNKWRLYKDPLFPVSQILLGYKGNHPYDAGYFWMPSVLLSKSPVTLDPDSFCPRQGILSNFTSRLANHGEDFYATISVSNFII